MPAALGPLSRLWRVRALGSPEQALRLESAPARAPGPGEVLVRVAAVGLNFPDLLLCAGRYQERPPLPFSPGYEAAGTIEQAGPRADLDAGEPVLVVPELPNGALQEFLTVPAAQVYPVPAAMPASQAAVLHIAYQTAYVALHHRAGLRAGETVLVTGAAGGVGSAAVQLAAAAGATVIGAVTGAAKAAACRAAGAHHVIDLAAETDPAGAVRAAAARLGAGRRAGGRPGADVIVDVVGGEAFDWVRRSAGFEGRIVLAGFASGSFGAIPANHVLLRNYSVLGLHLARYRREDPSLLRSVHQALLASYAAGAIRPLIHCELPFDQAPAGLALIASREVVGRVVLRC